MTNISANNSTTTPLLTRDDVLSVGEVVQPTPLVDLAFEIVADASSNPVEYLLRCDTGHDGE